MQTYEKYKDSGVEWIGEIPNSWKIMPLKRIGNLGKGLTFTKSDIIDCGNAVISYGQIHSKINSGTKINEYLIRHIPNELIQNYDESLTTKGDFIFADTSEDLEGCGNCVYIDNNNYSIYGGYHTIVLRTRNDENEYLSYLFKTDYWRSQIRSRVSGVKVYSITQGILSLTTICIPPIREQQCIATYLDKKCADIDKVIATQQRRIELLQELKQSTITHAVTRGLNPNVKMKDSGVEWIGEVPEHWNTLRLRFVCKLRNGYTPSKANPDFWSEGTIPWYRMEDIRESGRRLNEAKQYITESAIKGGGLFEAGSFIMATTATIGEHAVLIVDSLANQQFTNLKIRKSLSHSDFNAFFFQYLFVVDDYCKTTTKTATFPAVNMEDLKNFIVCIPPLDEQKIILTYLDKKCAELDVSISKAQREIDLLQEYKQALITEVVTGKRKVC